MRGSWNLKSDVKQNTALPRRKKASERPTAWEVQVNAGRFQDKHRGSVLWWRVSLTFGRPEIFFGIGKQHFIVNFWRPSRKRVSRVKREPTQTRVLLMWAWSRRSWKRLFYSLTAHRDRCSRRFTSFIYLYISIAHQRFVIKRSPWFHGGIKTTLPYDACSNTCHLTFLYNKCYTITTEICTNYKTIKWN